jgi:hypothetical protein
MCRNQNLNREFGVSGFVKPGAKTSDILDTNIDKDMSKDDIIVVCAGTNDISKNRHDLVDWSCVNKEVRSFNRHLAKRLKHVSVISVNLDRQHFTRHGLHTNNRGKDKMCQQVAELVQRELGAVVNAIPLHTLPNAYTYQTYWCQHCCYLLATKYRRRFREPHAWYVHHLLSHFGFNRRHRNPD